jgi:hypothetical protein
MHSASGTRRVNDVVLIYEIILPLPCILHPVLVE